MRVKVLYFAECPSRESPVPRLRALLKRVGVDVDVEAALAAVAERP